MRIDAVLMKTSAVTMKIDVVLMKTSAGNDYYVRFVREGKTVTPYVFKERYKAQYEADHFSWFFGLREEEPDILEYNEETYPNS